jgi:hypothetical protein
MVDISCGEILWYKMNETSGLVAYDSGPLSLNGAIGPENDLDQGVPPQGNGSIRFYTNPLGGLFGYSTGSFISVNADGNDLGISGAFSASVWIKEFTHGFVNPCIFSKGNSLRLHFLNEYLVWYAAPNVLLPAVSWLGGDTVARDGDWHNIVCTWDINDTTEGANGSAYIYCDGVEEAAGTYSAPDEPGTDYSNGDFYIGVNNTGDGADPIDAQMGDFKAYNYALSPSEISGIFTSGNPCLETPIPPDPDAMAASDFSLSAKWERINWVI